MGLRNDSYGLVQRGNVCHNRLRTRLATVVRQTGFQSVCRVTHGNEKSFTIR